METILLVPRRSAPRERNFSASAPTPAQATIKLVIFMIIFPAILIVGTFENIIHLAPGDGKDTLVVLFMWIWLVLFVQGVFDLIYQ